MAKRVLAVALGLLPVASAASAACAALAGLNEVPSVDDAGADASGADSEPDSRATAVDSGANEEPDSDASPIPPGDSASSGSDSATPSDGGEDAPDGTVPPEAPPDSPFDSPSDAAQDASLDSPVQDGSLCTPVASGLLGHWTMDANSIHGNVLQDTSGNQSHGTLIGFSSPLTVPGRFGEALSFGASGSAYVSVSSLSLDTTAGASNTVSLWFDRDSANLQDVLVYLPASPRYGLWLTGGTSMTAAGTFLCFNTGQADCAGIDDGTLLGSWVHVVAVFVNGSTTLDTLYVNGVKRTVACLTSDGFNSCSGLSATAGAPVTFGGQMGFYYHGLMDDVRIYGRALTPSEVSTLYDGSACP